MAAVSEAECLLHLEVSHFARDRAQQPNSPGNLVGDLVGNLVSDLVGIRCPGMFVRLCPYVGIRPEGGREETAGLKLGLRAPRPNVFANALYAGACLLDEPDTR